MVEPALVIVSDPEHRQLVIDELLRRGATPEVVEAGAPPHEYDLAVLDAAAVAAGALTALRARSPRAVAVVLASSREIPELTARLPVGSAVVDRDQLAGLLPRALADAVEVRDLRSEVERWRDTHTLTTALDAEQLPPQIAESALRLLRADAALLFVRGAGGKLVPGPTARPLAPRSVPPAAEAPRADRVAVERVRVPTEALRRRSERLVRAQASAVVREALADGWLIGRPLGGSDRPHAVLWALRGATRRPFDERDAVALEVLAEHATLALDHLRLVRDLEERLAGLQSTRQSMEEDKRAAQVGRLAIAALRNLQAPLAYMRTNLRQLASTEEIHPAGQAARHLQYVFDGLTRADTVAADMSRLSEGRERVPVEVRQLVDAALSLAGPLAAPATVEVETNAVILGHASRLADGLAELLKNASEATGVTRIDVRAMRQEGEVVIEVVDDGEGVAGDLLPRIREPFFSTRGRAGLGFTSACEAIEAAGGTVQLWSRAGIGTTVIATLPSQQAEDDLAIEADDDEPLESVEDDLEEVEAEHLEEAPVEATHSRKWMEDDEEESIVGGLDFSDLGDLAREE
jgi:signal transduction histidine kinase